MLVLKLLPWFLIQLIVIRFFMSFLLTHSYARTGVILEEKYWQSHSYFVCKWTRKVTFPLISRERRMGKIVSWSRMEAISFSWFAKSAAIHQPQDAEANSQRILQWVKNFLYLFLAFVALGVIASEMYFKVSKVEAIHKCQTPSRFFRPKSKWASVNPAPSGRRAECLQSAFHRGRV